MLLQFRWARWQHLAANWLCSSSHDDSSESRFRRQSCDIPSSKIENCWCCEEGSKASGSDHDVQALHHARVVFSFTSLGHKEADRPRAAPTWSITGRQSCGLQCWNRGRKFTHPADKPRSCSLTHYAQARKQRIDSSAYATAGDRLTGIWRATPKSIALYLKLLPQAHSLSLGASEQHVRTGLGLGIAGMSLD